MAPAWTWHETDLAVGGVRLHVRVRRPPDGGEAPPVLLLHGLGVGGVVWQAFARRLGPPFAAVAPDLRGHAGSEAPASGYRSADYAVDMGALLDVVAAGGVEGLQVADSGAMPVIGHSLGALVGLALAEARPERVSALVLVDPPVDAALRNPDVPEVYRRRHERPGALEEYLLEANPRGGALLARTLAGLFRQAADGAFEAMPRTPAGHPEAWERAERVAAPCLVVRGDPAAGGLLGDEAGRGFVARLPRGRLVAIPGASHSVHATHPAELAAAVLTFLGASTG